MISDDSFFKIITAILTVIGSIIGVYLTVRWQLRKHREQMIITSILEVISPFYKNIR